METKIIIVLKVLQKDLVTGFSDDSNSSTLSTSTNISDTFRDVDNSCDNKYGIPINSDNVLGDFDSCGIRRLLLS